jgi:hypothetical protein
MVEGEIKSSGGSFTGLSDAENPAIRNAKRLDTVR